MKPPHLYVALSGHGFGHLAQVAPVVYAWRLRQSQARVTVQTALPAAAVHARIGNDVQLVAGEADFGLRMVDALRVDVSASLAAYRAFHADWAARLAWQAARLHEVLALPEKPLVRPIGGEAAAEWIERGLGA